MHVDNPFEGRGNVFGQVVSVRDENVLYVNWMLPNQVKSKLDCVTVDYRQKADQYITHLLGYEGKHSLTSFLTDEGLITSLSANTCAIN